MPDLAGCKLPMRIPTNKYRDAINKWSCFWATSLQRLVPESMVIYLIREDPAFQQHLCGMHPPPRGASPGARCPAQPLLKATWKPHLGICAVMQKLFCFPMLLHHIISIKATVQAYWLLSNLCPIKFTHPSHSYIRGIIYSAAMPH